MTVKQHRIMKPYIPMIKPLTLREADGPRKSMKRVRAGHQTSSSVDTCLIQFPRILKGHSLKVSLPIIVDCEWPGAVSWGPSSWSCGKQCHCCLWLSRRQLSMWVFRAFFLLLLDLTPASSFIYVLLECFHSRWLWPTALINLRGLKSLKSPKACLDL